MYDDVSVVETIDTLDAIYYQHVTTNTLIVQIFGICAAALVVALIYKIFEEYTLV